MDPGLELLTDEESKRLKALIRKKAEEGGKINFKGEKFRKINTAGEFVGTWSKWKLALLKSSRIENFMDELNNRQNAESDGLRNF